MDPVENDVYVKLRDYFHLKLEAKSLTAMDERETVNVLKFILRVYDQGWTFQNQESIGADAKRCLSCLNRMDLGYLASKVSDLTDTRKKVRLLGALIGKTESRHNGRKNISAISLRLHQLESKHGGPSRALPAKPVLPFAKKVPEPLPSDVLGQSSFKPILPTREIPRTPIKAMTSTNAGKVKETTVPLARPSPVMKKPAAENVPHRKISQKEKPMKIAVDPEIDQKSTGFQPILPTREIPRTPMAPVARSRHNDTYTVESDDSDQDLNKEGPVDSSTPVNSSKEKNLSDGTFTVSESPEMFNTAGKDAEIRQSVQNETFDCKKPAKMDGTFTKASISDPDSIQQKSSQDATEHKATDKPIREPITMETTAGTGKGERTTLQENPSDIQTKPRVVPDPSEANVMTKSHSRKGNEATGLAKSELPRQVQDAGRVEDRQKEATIDPVPTAADDVNKKKRPKVGRATFHEKKAAVEEPEILVTSRKNPAVDPDSMAVSTLKVNNIPEETVATKTKSANSEATKRDSSAKRIDPGTDIIDKDQVEIGRKRKGADRQATLLSAEDPPIGNGTKVTRIDPSLSTDNGLANEGFQKESKAAGITEKYKVRSIEESGGTSNGQTAARNDPGTSTVSNVEKKPSKRREKPKAVERVPTNQNDETSQTSVVGNKETRIDPVDPEKPNLDKINLEELKILNTSETEALLSAIEASRSSSIAKDPSRVESGISKVDKSCEKQLRRGRKLKQIEENLSDESESHRSGTKEPRIDLQVPTALPTTRKPSQRGRKTKPLESIYGLQAPKSLGSPDEESSIDPEASTVDPVNKRQPRGSRKPKSARTEPAIQHSEESGRPRAEFEGFSINPEATEAAVTVKTKPQRRTKVKSTNEEPVNQSSDTGSAQKKSLRRGRPAKSTKDDESLQDDEDSASRTSQQEEPKLDPEDGKTDGSVQKPLQRRKRAAKDAESTTDNKESKCLSDTAESGSGSQAENGSADSEPQNQSRKSRSQKRKVCDSHLVADEILSRDLRGPDELRDPYPQDTKTRTTVRKAAVKKESRLAEPADLNPQKEMNKTKGRTTKTHRKANEGLVQEAADSNPPDFVPENRTEGSSGSMNPTDATMIANPQESADPEPISQLKKTRGRTAKKQGPKAKEQVRLELADPNSQHLSVQNQTEAVSKLMEDCNKKDSTSAVNDPLFANPQESPDSKPTSHPRKTNGRIAKKQDAKAKEQVLLQTADPNSQDPLTGNQAEGTLSFGASKLLEDCNKKDPKSTTILEDPQESADFNPQDRLSEKKTKDRKTKLLESSKMKTGRPKKQQLQESAVPDPHAPKSRSKKRLGSRSMDFEENNPIAVSTNHEARLDDVTGRTTNQNAVKTPVVSKKTRNVFVLALESSTPTLKVVANPAKKNRRKNREESPTAAVFVTKPEKALDDRRSEEKGPGSPETAKLLSDTTQSVKTCAEDDVVQQRPRRGRKPLKPVVEVYCSDADDAETAATKRKRPTRR